MGLLVVSILVQAWLTSTKRIPLSSDQAIVCLMANHILERGEHPIFYYGSAYAGSLEPHYVAGVFALFGKSPASYRVATGGLVLLMLIGVYAIARQAFGSLAAILALAYLAVPPFFFLYKGLTSDGHYDAFNLFVVGVVLVCIRIENSLASSADLRRLLIGLGFIFGLGWWINPITPPISAAAVVWLFLRKGHPPIRQAAWLVVGFPAGSAPWFYWNVHHGWASLAMPELRHVSVGGALHNLAEVFRHSIPLLAGGMRFRMATSWNTFPLSSTLVLGALIIIVMLGFRRALRGDRVLRLLFLCFLLLVATVIWSTRYVPGEPRVLFPYYVLIPPVLGLGLATLARRGIAGRLLAVLLGGFCFLPTRPAWLSNTATFAIRRPRRPPISGACKTSCEGKAFATPTPTTGPPIGCRSSRTRESSRPRYREMKRSGTSLTRRRSQPTPRPRSSCEVTAPTAWRLI
jgi:hypothetical protein